MLKKNINELILYFSKYFLSLFVKLNSPLLSSMILLINLRKVKKIYTYKKNKKVIILPKSNGLEDILSAYNKFEKNNDISFYVLPRVLIKTIFFRFLQDNSNHFDYLTIDLNEKDKKNKQEYKLFIKKTFLNLNKVWSFNAIIGFNPFYFAEHDLPEPIREIGKKFLIIHKESVFNEIGDINSFKIYRDKNKKHLASKVAVYSENAKKQLVGSNFLNSNQIEVTGCARTSNCFEIRNDEPSVNKIVYYMIYDRFFRPYEKGYHTKEWSRLASDTIEYLIEYAIKNPLVDIVFKGKMGVHSLKDLPKKLPTNCSFLSQYDPHKLLKEAKVVICFNSTILYEAIIANREIVIPNFGVDSEKLKTFIYKSPNFFADTKENFFKMINEKLKKNFKLKNFSKIEIECLNFYLGNADGKAGHRLRKFIEKNF